MKLFNGLDHVRTYINDLLISSNKSFEDHIKKLDKVLSKLESSGFKVDEDKLIFVSNEVEYIVSK